MNTATQPGADPDVKIDEVVATPSKREIAIEAMSDRVEAERTRELAEAIEADPGLAINQAAIDNQIRAANAAAIEAGELPPPEQDLDGAASRQPMHPEVEQKPVPLPADLAGDPLAEYVVMEQGKPMFRAKVNGEVRLIPLEDARRQIQIGTAAEIRMQQAANRETNITQRESDLGARELAFAQRVTTAPEQPAVPAQADLSEDDLLDEAREIFNTAFSGTEEDAAKKLAKTLSKLRAPAPAQAQVVDENAIVGKAARAAVSAMQNVDKKKDVQSGYAKFQKDYPDIMADPELYKMADGMTDEIATENPNWEISRVMQEAGKRTQAWVGKLQGVAPQAEPSPGTDTIPDVTQHPTQSRQERKSELVRMPQSAAGAVHEDPADEPVREQSPQEAFAEIKKVRGQPQ